MHKKTLKNQHFFAFFVLVMFFFAISCSKSVENCKYSPDFDISSESLSESLDGIVQIEKMQAKARCKF